MVGPCSRPQQQVMLMRGTKDKEHAMAEALRIAFVGIDIGKNSFHVVGLDGRGAIVLRQKWSRPGRSSVREYTALSNRDGGLRGGASS